jgi:hypothetical protein
MTEEDGARPEERLVAGHGTPREAIPTFTPQRRVNTSP